jgi:hypothetical protein
VNGTDISQVVFDLQGPVGTNWMEANSPYYFMGDSNGKPYGWSTLQFPNGTYTLKATATNHGGQSQSATVAFAVANGGASPPPAATSTPVPSATKVPPTATPTKTPATAPTATPTKSPTSAPSPGLQLTGFGGVSDGQTLKGKVVIQALVSGTGRGTVEFELSGPKTAKWQENDAPYYFLGEAGGSPKGWDTSKYPNGDYELQATLTGNGMASQSRSVRFTVKN